MGYKGGGCLGIAYRDHRGYKGNPCFFSFFFCLVFFVVGPLKDEPGRPVSE